MTVKTFCEKLAVRVGISFETAEIIYRELMETMKDAVASGEEVTFIGLGTWHTKLDSKANRPIVLVDFRQAKGTEESLFERCPFREEILQMSQSQPQQQPRRAVLTEDRPSTGMNPTETSRPIRERQEPEARPMTESGERRVIQESPDAPAQQ